MRLIEETVKSTLFYCSTEAAALSDFCLWASISLQIILLTHTLSLNTTGENSRSPYLLSTPDTPPQFSLGSRQPSLSAGQPSKPGRPAGTWNANAWPISIYWRITFPNFVQLEWKLRVLEKTQRRPTSFGNFWAWQTHSNNDFKICPMLGSALKKRGEPRLEISYYITEHTTCSVISTVYKS